MGDISVCIDMQHEQSQSNLYRATQHSKNDVVELLNKRYCFATIFICIYTAQ